MRRGLKMARNSSQSVFKEQSIQAIKDAGIIFAGVEIGRLLLDDISSENDL